MARLFRKKRAKRLLWLLILLAVCLALSESAGRLEDSGAGKTALVIFSPFLKLADGVRGVGAFFGRGFYSTTRLRRENEKLRKEIVALKLELEKKRRELRTRESLERLDASESAEKIARFRVLPCRVLAYSPQPWNHTIIINRGTQDGVRKEQTVMTDEGVVGAVSQCGATLSRVQLLIDRRSAVTVRVSGSEELAVAEGAGDPDELIIRAEGTRLGLSVNQKAVTAGLKGSLFPGGLPVGLVSEVERDKRGRVRARATPAADFRRLDPLFVLAGSEKWREAGFENGY